MSGVGSRDEHHRQYIPSDEQDPNDHPGVFAEFAASTDWIWVHYGQFAAVMVLLAGFVVLHRALMAGNSPRIVDQLALIATITSAAHPHRAAGCRRRCPENAVDAWAAATGPEQIARFGDAETVR